MRDKILIGIFFFLFVLTTTGVFAAMVGNSRQGLPAISVTSQPGSTSENPGTHQGSGLCLRIFTANATVGFNGGYNLYRYADNNPVLFIDPYGLSACYKDLVVRVVNRYDATPFSYAKATLNTAFSFFQTITDGPQIRVYDVMQPGNKDKLGVIGFKDGGLDGLKTWTDYTRTILDSYTIQDNQNSKIANIVISNTTWQSIEGAPAGLTDKNVGQPGKNRSLVSGNYIPHSDPYKLGWTVAHETGHILRGLGESADGVMCPGSWNATEFSYEDQQSILEALTKN
jgi:hypothetical protein